MSETIRQNIIEVLLTHRRPMTRGELAGRAQTTIRGIASPLRGMIEEGIIEEVIRRAGRLEVTDTSMEVELEQRYYRLAGPRLIK